MSLSDLEKEILAEGEKVAAWVRSEALKLRKSKIVEELEQIEAELAGKSTPEADEAEAEPEPAPKAKKETAAEPKADADDAESSSKTKKS